MQRMQLPPTVATRCYTALAKAFDYSDIEEPGPLHPATVAHNDAAGKTTVLVS
jgi:hypothetical protein